MMFASATLFYALAAVLGYADFTIFWFIAALAVDAAYEFVKFVFSSKEFEYIPIPKVIFFYLLLIAFSSSGLSYVWLGIAFVMDAWRLLWRLMKQFIR